MSGIFENPVKYIEDRTATLGEDDQLFVRKLKELIMKSITDLEHAPMKEKSKCAEALEKLVKIWLLLSGRATDRKEVIEQRKLTLEAIINKTKEEKGEDFLDVVDYRILEELEEPKDDKG